MGEEVLTPGIRTKLLWSTPYTYILLIIGILLLPLFFFIELRISSYPLLSLRALKHTASSVTFVLFIIACGWGCFGIWLLYMWQVYMELREASPLFTSAYMAPVVIIGAVAAIATRGTNRARLDDGCGYERLPHGHHTGSDHTHRPDILEPGVHLCAGYHLGHGHELPRGDGNSKQCRIFQGAISSTYKISSLS